MADVFTRHGKQVLRNGEHFCDAVDEHAAEQVVLMAEALMPFAGCLEYIKADEPDDEWAKFRLVIGDYRRAGRAINV